MADVWLTAAEGSSLVAQDRETLDSELALLSSNHRGVPNYWHTHSTHTLLEVQGIVRYLTH